jgi:hypothetical protein
MRSSLITCLLGTVVIIVVIMAVIIAAGCSGQDVAPSTQETPEPDGIASASELQRHVQALRDSLQEQHLRIEHLERELQLEKKVQPLLLDRRVGLWAPDEQADSIHFEAPVAAHSAADIVSAFNQMNAGTISPILELQTVRGHTAYVAVSDDAQLGSRMGSAGARMYVSAMTYALTSHPEIDSVYLDIRAGDHANPGLYARRSWVGLVRE